MKRQLAVLRSAFVMLAEDPAVDADLPPVGPPNSFLAWGQSRAFFENASPTDDIDRLASLHASVRCLQARIEQLPKASDRLGPRASCRRRVGADRWLATRSWPDRRPGSPCPETGLGIYPGMGGTQRSARRIGIGLANWMIYTGAIVPGRASLGDRSDRRHRRPEATSRAEAFAALDRPSARVVRSGSPAGPPQMATL